MILIFLGPPGSGKGTQAKMLAEKINLAHLSLGDILREEVRSGTDLGRRAKEFMDAGRLVPDELTIELTRKRIAPSGFIIDGFPRTTLQAEAFDKMLVDLGLKLDAAVYFQITEDQATERLLRRAGLEGRADDNEEAIRTRFEVYERQTRPLIEHYSRMGKLAQIDAARSIEEVFAELTKITAIAAVL
jgi:adenylate kinase